MITGEEPDFAETYLQSFLENDAKHGRSRLRVHERHELASPVTPVNSSIFAAVRRAVLETLAKDRVREYLDSHMRHNLSAVCPARAPATYAWAAR